VGVGRLNRALGVVCSASDELVVADTDNQCLRVFSDVGELLATVGEGHFTGVVMHGSTVFATDVDARAVTQFL
jgi:hypothetical protein